MLVPADDDDESEYGRSTPGHARPERAFNLSLEDEDDGSGAPASPKQSWDNTGNPTEVILAGLCVPCVAASSFRALVGDDTCTVSKLPNFSWVQPLKSTIMWYCC